LKRHVFLCNGVPKSRVRRGKTDKSPIVLDYRDDQKVRLKLPNFLQTVFHIPPRLLDLLEIAAYVFAADRLVGRGATDVIDFSAWSRDFRFVIKVRDKDFWESEITKRLLSDALCFVSGDRSFDFTFLPGHTTGPQGLFDQENFVYEPGNPHHVMLFSGGLDSLAGAVERLRQSKDTVCLVSHRSSLPSTAKTQNALVSALRKEHGNRVLHYCCSSHLLGGRAVDEAQRTRSFLYGSIAFALARALNQDSIHFYENGVTSLNFQRRQDLLNARASRTTHPQTLYRLKELFSHINGQSFSVENPYRSQTKTDVLRRLAQFGGGSYLSSSVSCSKTFRTEGPHTHCGACFQCIDRRFAVYGSSLVPFDNELLYAFDITSQSIGEPETRTAVIDYVRAAIRFATCGIDKFVVDHVAELSQTATPGVSEAVLIEQTWGLMRRFGSQLLLALKHIQREKDDLSAEATAGSLLQLVAEREYLREDAERLSRRIAQRLRIAVPKMFRRNRPADENDFNDKLNGLIEADRTDYVREFPATVFAGARAIPDHELSSPDLLIEANTYVAQQQPEGPRRQ
jgi:7-cyano-7-deazaguanine synthase in queuosine biosynthesis